LAAPDSTQAVASAVAIEAVGRLSGPQMDLLGLAALLYYVAPMTRAPKPVLADDPRLVGVEPAQRGSVLVEIDREGVIEYLTWLVGALDRHDIPDPISALDFAHLASASCGTYDRMLSRELPRVLQRLSESEIFHTGLRNGYQARLPSILYASPSWTQLDRQWTGGLQHFTLTPAGLLIGVIVHQWKTQEEIAIQWELGTSDAFRDERAWDGQTINRNFYDRLTGQLESDLRAKMRAGGVMPWELHR